MLPPTSVQLVGTSFTKIQTHIGPSVNSKSIKSVNSAANRCFAAIRNNVFTVADKSPPRIKQISKSFQEIAKLSQVKSKATSLTNCQPRITGCHQNKSYKLEGARKESTNFGWCTSKIRWSLLSQKELGGKCRNVPRCRNCYFRNTQLFCSAFYYSNEFYVSFVLRNDPLCLWGWNAKLSWTGSG